PPQVYRQQRDSWPGKKLHRLPSRPARRPFSGIVSGETFWNSSVPPDWAFHRSEGERTMRPKFRLQAPNVKRIESPVLSVDCACRVDYFLARLCAVREGFG